MITSSQIENLRLPSNAGPERRAIHRRQQVVLRQLRDDAIIAECARIAESEVR